MADEYDLALAGDRENLVDGRWQVVGYQLVDSRKNVFPERLER